MISLGQPHIPISWYLQITTLVIDESAGKARDVLNVLKFTEKLEDLTIVRILWDPLVEEHENQLATLAAKLRQDVGDIHLPLLRPAILGFHHPSPEFHGIPRGLGMSELLRNHLRAPALRDSTLRDV